MKGKTIVAALALMLASMAWAQSDTNNSDKKTVELQRATEIVQQMTSSNAPDTGVPSSVLDRAKCVAVIPKMMKGAFVVGGEHGSGVATCKNGTSWSAPAPFSVSGISFGPQIGGKSTDLLMFIMNDQGMNQLMSGHFKVGGDVSAAAGPVGRSASADAGYKAAILTYSNSKGAFIGASINGAELNQDKKATVDWYGKDIPIKDILMGQVKSPTPETTAFVNAVSNAKMSASQ